MISPINISEEICDNVIISPKTFTKQQQQLRQDSVIKKHVHRPDLGPSTSSHQYTMINDNANKHHKRKRRFSQIDKDDESSESDNLSFGSSFHLSDEDADDETISDDDEQHLDNMVSFTKRKRKLKRKQSGDQSTNSVENPSNANLIFGARDKKDLLKYKTLDDGSVICKLCNRHFASRTQWYRHKYKSHNESETIVTVHPVNMESFKDTFQNTEKALSVSALFQCDKCQVFYKSRRGYLGHMKRRHKNDDNNSGGSGSNNVNNHSQSDDELDTNLEKAARTKNRDSNMATSDSGQIPEDVEKQRQVEEKIINDIIERVKRECQAQGLPT